MARERGAAAERIWQERLARYRRCDETVADFCEREGVSTPTFYAWKRRLSGARMAQGRAEKQSTPLFVPVTVGAVAAGVRIVLPGGAIVELPPGADERLLRTCIRAAVERDHDGPDAC